MVGVKRKLTPEARDQSPQPSSTEPAGSGQGTQAERSRGRSHGRVRRAPADERQSERAEFPEAQPRPKRTRRTSRDESAAEHPAGLASPRSIRQSTRLLSKGQSGPPTQEPSTAAPTSFSGLEQSAKDVDDVPQQAHKEDPDMPAKPASFHSADTESSAPEKAFLDNQSKYKTEYDSPAGPSDAEDSVKDDCPSPTGAKPEADQGSDEQKRSFSEEREAEDQKGEGSSIDDGDHVKMEEPETDVAPSGPQSPSRNEDTQDTADVAAAAAAGTAPEPEPTSQSVSTSSPPGQEVPAAAVSPSPAPIGLATVEASPNLSPADSVATPIPRRRGYRGRTSGALARGGRGRGRGRGRGGRQGLKLSMRSEPITELGKKLRDRQKELERAYRKVAAAQKLALITLAGRTEAQLIKDPKAHIGGPEYESVVEGLGDALVERHRTLDLQRTLGLNEAEVVREGTEHLLRKCCNITMESIIDEQVVAARGGFMDQVEKCRQAQDDDRTEVNGDENGADAARASDQKFVRGFDSRVVSSREGARFFDRAQDEWDEFIQRAKILDDISPQIDEMNPTSRRGDEQASPKSGNISVLVDALVEMSRDAVDEKEAATQNKQSAAQNIRLAALADMAEAKRNTEQQPGTSAQPMPPPPARAPQAVEQRRYSEQLPPYHHLQAAPAPRAPAQDASRQLLPHYPPPLSGLQPPGHPHDPQVGMPRPLLPARGQSQPAIPPLSEHLKLPDPFSSNAPRLPAPQGVGYHLPPHNAQHHAHAPAPVPAPTPAPPSGYPSYPSPYMQGPPSGPAGHPYYAYPPYMMQHPPPPPPHHPHGPPHGYSNAPHPQQMPPPPPPQEQRRYSQQPQHPHRRTHPY